MAMWVVTENGLFVLRHKLIKETFIHSRGRKKKNPPACETQEAALELIGGSLQLRTCVSDYNFPKRVPLNWGSSPAIYSLFLLAFIEMQVQAARFKRSGTR